MKQGAGQHRKEITVGLAKQQKYTQRSRMFHRGRGTVVCKWQGTEEDDDPVTVKVREMMTSPQKGYRGNGFPGEPGLKLGGNSPPTSVSPMLKFRTSLPSLASDPCVKEPFLKVGCSPSMLLFCRDSSNMTLTQQGRNPREPVVWNKHPFRQIKKKLYLAKKKKKNAKLPC